MLCCGPPHTKLRLKHSAHQGGLPGFCLWYVPQACRFPACNATGMTDTAGWALSLMLPATALNAHSPLPSGSGAAIFCTQCHQPTL